MIPENSLIRSNLFHIVVSTSYPESEKLFNPDRIRRYIRKFTTIKEWALILHDRDVYTEIDEAVNPLHKKGTPKPPHYHFIIKSENYNRMNNKSISKWFSVPENLIDKPEKCGVKGFDILLMYFTHMSDECKRLGKSPYSIDEIYSNVNVSSRLWAIENKNNSSINKVEVLSKVYDGLLSLEEVRDKYGEVFFQRNFNDIVKRKKQGEDDRKEEKMKNSKSKLPDCRINVYVYGHGGTGKTALCDAISYMLYPSMNEDKRVFNTSSNGSTLKKYDYQPCVIWDEGKASKLLDDLKNQSNVLKVFRPHPRIEEVDTKYGSILLLNKYSLVNSSEDYDSFIRSLSIGDDSDQYFRRFLIYIKIGRNKITLFSSERIYNRDSEYRDMKERFSIDENISYLFENLEKSEVYNYLKKRLAPIIKYFKDTEKFLLGNTISKEDKIKFLLERGMNPDEILQNKN